MCLYIILHKLHEDEQQIVEVKKQTNALNPFETCEIPKTLIKMVTNVIH